MTQLNLVRRVTCPGQSRWSVGNLSRTYSRRSPRSRRYRTPSVPCAAWPASRRSTSRSDDGTERFEWSVHTGRVGALLMDWPGAEMATRRVRRSTLAIEQKVNCTRLTSTCSWSSGKMRAIFGPTPISKRKNSRLPRNHLTAYRAPPSRSYLQFKIRSSPRCTDAGPSSVLMKTPLAKKKPASRIKISQPISFSTTGIGGTSSSIPLTFLKKTTHSKTFYFLWLLPAEFMQVGRKERSWEVELQWILLTMSTFCCLFQTR